MPKPTNSSQYPYMFSDDMKFLQKVIVLHPQKEGVFLILKRSSTSHSRPGDWDFPGGNVLYGEKHLDSLLREIDEETKLAVDELIPVEVVTRYDEMNNIYFLGISYRAKALGDNVTLSREHTEYKWVTLEEFLSMNTADFLHETAKKAF